MNSNIGLQIDNVYFELSGKITNENDRNKVFITSINADTEEVISFYVYESISELGFWRLGFFDKSIDKYYKGDTDYVQQTFINLKLQKFINDEYNNPNLNEMSNLNYNLNRNHVKNHINNKNRKKEFRPRNEYIEMRSKCGNKTTEKTYLYIDRISQYLKKFYNYDYSNIEHLYDYTFDKQLDHYNVKSINNIYKLLLTHKKNGTILYLYYMKYNLTINERQYNNYYIPIFLTENDNITLYGTYANYVEVGSYICKPLDYHEQCTINEEIHKCTSQYTFIGNRFNNVYPLNEIKIIETPEKIGLIIGRFQPLTNAHLEQLILPALHECSKVIVILGSSNEHSNIRMNENLNEKLQIKWLSKNPFTYEQRKEMILNTISFQNPEYIDKLIILPMEDATIEGKPPSESRINLLISKYNINIPENGIRTNIWYYYLGNILRKYLSHNPNIKIIFFGSEKDPATEAYLKKVSDISLHGLPYEKHFSPPRINNTTGGTVNATKIRKIIFKNTQITPDEKIYLNTYVPRPVLDFINVYKIK